MIDVPENLRNFMGNTSRTSRFRAGPDIKLGSFVPASRFGKIIMPFVCTLGSGRTIEVHNKLHSTHPPKRPDLSMYVHILIGKQDTVSGRPSWDRLCTA